MENFGLTRSILNENECEEFKRIFLKNTPTLSNLGDKCYGIDVNNISSYLWFKKKFLTKIQKNFDVELKLIFSFYASFTQPFPIHHDIKPIPNDAKGRPYVSCLIPISVDGNKDLCHLASTVIFKKGNNEDFQRDYKEHLSHCELAKLQKRQIDKIFQWNTCDMIWWKSELDHCSGHFKNFKNKQCFVVHTYVE